MPMRQFPSRILIWMPLLVALLVLAAHHVAGLPDWNGVIRDGIYNGLLAAAALICVGRGIRVREHRASWLLIGFGLAAWTAADIYWTVALAELDEPPYPSISDAGWIVFYPALVIGVILMLRGEGRRFERILVLDASIAAFSAAALVTAIVFPPILAMSLEGTASAVAVNLAYPVGDLLLLVLLILSCGLYGWHPPRIWLWLGAGLVLTGVADVAYLYAVAHGATEAPGWAIVCWPAAAVATCVAALQPPPPARRAGELERASGVLVPGIFVVAAFTVLIWDHFDRVSHLGAVLAGLALVAAFVRAGLTVRAHRALLGHSRDEARTDALTGLGNRRALTVALDDALSRATPESPYALVVFDLNGFKAYNDTFGHPAGDALLTRLGGALADAVAPVGSAFRMGGDEFCVLATVPPGESEASITAAALAALSDRGDGFEVGAAHGAIRLSSPGMDAGEALREADRRMYAQKDSGRESAGGQSVEVLARLLAERDGNLADHLDDVAELCDAVCRALGMSEHERTATVRAATLHDIGKAAIPDAILNKPGPLDREEWEFMRRHTIIGERILAGAPSLTRVAKLVRASHERVDGTGYPDGLAGDDVPLGARVIAVCDSYDAMVTDRPYRAAMAPEDAIGELRRCAGTQFDPEVVEAFADLVTREQHPTAQPRSVA
jgi:two-component system, cell cycle response regulator